MCGQFSQSAVRREDLKTSVKRIDVIQFDQGHVLGNENNKRLLITFLCEALQKEEVEVAVVEEDADRVMVMTAFSKRVVADRVVIVGEDIDLFILLNGLGAEETNVCPQNNMRGETGCCHYSMTYYNHHDSQRSPGTVLFTHAFAGCDTTSAPFGHGKTKITTPLSKSEPLTEQVEVLLRQDFTPQAVREAGIKCVVALYGGEIARDNLDFLRYKTFVTSTSINLNRFATDGRCRRPPCSKVLPPSA
ncbi:unnamed protein product [Psylliodes chrysocephalus]|uniref:Uncharacterized protein n=1 Tax=Psylliodes chrysocephalus TaxID=3402493 RepID=A0A9P0CJF9_9CUCU|nr:unnamed protein product [Psylliodes chrysocephala]